MRIGLSQFQRVAGSFFTEDNRLGAGGGAARGCGLFTEDYLLGAVSGAAGSCGLFTEDYLLGAVGGAAGGCEPERRLIKA